MKISDDVRYLQKELHEVMSIINSEMRKPFHSWDNDLLDKLDIQKEEINNLLK